jgi:hypothetical protein
MAWLVAALGVSLTVGPQLGWRGWLWLALHNLLCAVGAGHELWRTRERPGRPGGVAGGGLSPPPQEPPG